jgi:hypothetical protein
MQFSFDMPEVEKWAEFSSDYNPIHFDIERARVAGLDALILHGMLALLPVKQSVCGQTPAQGWMKFRALFRNPIPHGRMIALDARPSKAGLNFRVSALADQYEHFRGAYVQADNPASELNGVDMEFETALKHEQARRFFEYYPHIEERWIALDAVIFSEFMRTKLSIIEDMAQVHMMRLDGNARTNKVVVQLSHTVTFDSDFFKDALDEAAWDKISYALTLPKMVASANQLAGTVSLPVMSGGRLVMLMEIGLVSKFDNNNLN